MEIEISAQDRLREAGIRVTTPRLLVYQYLLDNKIHPTCDQIYNSVHKDNPGISLASVYNVTEKLVEERLVMKITSPNGEGHYDSITDYHGHFFCNKCGEIYDFPARYDKLPPNLSGSHITSVSYVVEGHCPSCNKAH